MSSTQLVDDVLTEVLLRLPPESVLRVRTVSKHWRRITTCPSFLAAYSRRQPLELLVFPHGYKIGPGANNVLAGVDPAVVHDTAGCRRFMRFHNPLRLADSCDGLLLFALSQKSFLICNPATRQWASLPSLTPEPCACVVPSGLYFHPPSGEHRLLCIGALRPPWFKYHPPSGRYRYHRRLPPHGSEDAPPYVDKFYYILSTGAAEPRRLRPVATGGGDPFPSASVTLGGTLHWSHHPESGGDGGKMVAFDTVSETFRLISLPPLIGFGGLSHHLRLFDMDGTLAVSAVRAGSPCMDVWALEDDDGGGGDRWACRLRIDDLPPARRFEWHASYEAVAVVEGGVLVVVGSGWVLLYDMKEKRTVSMADRHSGGDIRNLSQCLYRASLVSLPEPDAQPCPCASPGGKPLLQYCSADDHLYMLSKGSKCDAWIVPNQI